MAKAVANTITTDIAELRRQLDSLTSTGPDTITGTELRNRLDALRPRSYVEAAAWLGLTRDGLAKAFAGKRPVGKQTQIILAQRELIQNSLDSLDTDVLPCPKTRSTRRPKRRRVRDDVLA